MGAGSPPTEAAAGWRVAGGLGAGCPAVGAVRGDGVGQRRRALRGLVDDLCPIWCREVGQRTLDRRIAPQVKHLDAGTAQLGCGM